MTRSLAIALCAALIVAGLAGLSDKAFATEDTAKSPTLDANLWGAKQANSMQQWLARKQASGLKVPPKPADGGYYIYIPGSAAKTATH
jgi:hypothetical protein